MYKVSKRMEIAGAHKLALPYESPCQNVHGHNWIVTIECVSAKLTDYGMIVDFARLKKEIHGVLDHSYINDKLPNGMNPTAENMARWIANKTNALCEVGFCSKVTVQESEGNIATWIDPRIAILDVEKEVWEEEV